MILRILVMMAGMVASGLLSAQTLTFPIHVHNGQEIETCSGVFTDSGSDTLSAYANNEEYSVTFRTEEIPGTTQYLKLDFSFFDLGSGDFLYIYDGPDANAELLVAATGNELQAKQIWSTQSSLHIRFESSPSDTALGWRAGIECFELCEAFYADITTPSGSSFDFCPDVQSVTFTAEAGYYGGNPSGTLQDISYQWNFDGDTSQGSTATNTYSEPGAYPFRITIADAQNGCSFDSIITVRLATVPHFENTQLSVDTVCANEPFSLLGSVQSVSWTGFPTSVDTSFLLAPGEAFTSSLTFDVFPQGQQIVLMEDFDRICFNLEHEDFGHLELQLECPSGNTVTLKQQGLGGAHLGEPVVYGNEDIPGIGYEYCYSTTPQFGNMDETAFHFHTYTDQAGDLYNNQAYLPAGSYSAAQSFSNLNGCPLNGTWTIRAQDQINGTSGHLLGWSMFFNEDFYPDSLIFTPEIVEEKWFNDSGNEIGNNPANATLSTEGIYDFTYRVWDNFGCSYDTTLTLLVLPLPKAEIVSELELPLCEGDSTLLTVTPELVGEEENWQFQWMLEGEELEGRIFDTIMAKQMANYMVRITDTLTGCFAFIELAVSDQNCDLTIPNVFTPNGDGINDLFEIQNLEYYPGSTIVIYNRNGKKVFESNDYYLNWWDGNNQAQGTYYYVITYTRLNQRKQTQGVITLIR